MPTISRTDIRGEMLRRAPILGRRLTADSLTKAGPSLTHVAEYERQRAGLTSYEGQYIHRYLQPDPDRWRRITTLNAGATDGVINLDGPNLTNNTDLAYERLLFHPDDYNFAIQEGQRRQRVRTNIALAQGTDLTMEGSAGVTYWNGVAAGALSNMTLAKDTTVAFSGTQSLLCGATNASNYCRSEIVRVTPGRQIFAACIVLVSAQSFIFNLVDAITGIAFGDTVTFQGLGGWTLCFIQATVPTTTYLASLQFSGSASGSTFWVDTCFGPYEAGKTEYGLPVPMNEAYKLRFVRPSRFVSPTLTNGCYAADSLTYDGDLTSPEDWNMEVFKRDINSNRLRFQSNSYNITNVGWGTPSGGDWAGFMSQNMRPIWLAMEAQVSDFEPLLTEAATTSQPLDECACYSLRYLFETLAEREPSNIVWQNGLQEYKAWSVIEDQARPPQAMQPHSRYHAIRA